MTGVDVGVSGFEASSGLFFEIVGELAGEEAGGWTAAVLESRLEARGRELMCRLFQDHVDLRAVREERVDLVVDADAVPRGTVEAGRRRALATVFGDVSVGRLAYRRRSLPDLHVADAALNLPEERHSHGLRRLAAIESARGSFEEAADAVVRATGQRLGKRQVQDLAERAAVDFDGFYASRAPLAAGEGDVLVLSMDGKGIVMRPEALRTSTATAAGRVSAGALANEGRRNRKRMAEVGAVFDITPSVRSPSDIMRRPGDTRPVPDGPKTQGKWYVASVTEDTATVISEVFAEADRRDPDRRRRWIALVDGNNHQLDRIRTEAAARGHPVTIIVDFVHVLEYLHEAARCLYRDGDPATAGWVHERAHEILQGHATRVAGAIRRRATGARLTAAARADADRCADYLTNKAPYLDYPTALSAGWPIATGVIEGACRHLVKDRMDITGARWGLDGAEAILRLRALRTNGDFDSYWTYHLTREHERIHQSRYLYNLIPTPETHPE